MFPHQLLKNGLSDLFLKTQDAAIDAKQRKLLLDFEKEKLDYKLKILETFKRDKIITNEEYLDLKIIAIQVYLNS